MRRDGMPRAGLRRDGGMLTASLLVVAATASGSAANFLFQWLAARRLDPGNFSLLAAMLALVTLAVLPGPPLAIAIVRRLSRHPEGMPAPSLGRARTLGIGTGLAILGAIILGAALGGDRLHLAAGGGGLLWFAAAAVTVSWLVVFPDLARVQASGDFGRYGRSHALLAATRLGFGGGALIAGAGPGIALLLLAPGPWLVHALLRPRETGPALAGPSLRELLPLLAATGGLNALVAIDVVFARAHFGTSDPHAAGAYAVCATLARALFHLPFAATAVTVQRTAAAARAGQPHRNALLANLGIAVGMIGAGALLLGLLPQTALRIFAGEGRYEGESQLLVRLLLPMALASLAAVPAHYLLALGRRTPTVVLGIAPLVLAGLLARPISTPSELIPPLIGVQAITLAILWVAAWRAGTSRSIQRDHATQQTGPHRRPGG